MHGQSVKKNAQKTEETDSTTLRQNEDAETRGQTVLNLPGYAPSLVARNSYEGMYKTPRRLTHLTIQSEFPRSIALQSLGDE